LQSWGWAPDQAVAGRWSRRSAILHRGEKLPHRFVIGAAPLSFGPTDEFRTLATALAAVARERSDLCPSGRLEYASPPALAARGKLW
jgi:hypothetical protein